jgi:hypothetical protein
MFVAGADGCRKGRICFKVERPSLTTSVENFDLGLVLKNRPKRPLDSRAVIRRPTRY